MVSGCNIVQGCEEEDVQEGISREYSFRLKLNSKLNKQNVPSSTSDVKPSEEDEARNSRYLCLAADSDGSLNKWLNTVAISSQTPDKVNFISSIPDLSYTFNLLISLVVSSQKNFL